MPKISVIMPIYNGERFLKPALDSLLAQSFSDWELIAVDDGSRDATPQILGQYTDARIKVIRQENRGEAAARNTGLQHSTGEYVSFLDADDLYLPNALQDLSAYMDAHPQCGVVFSDGEIFDEQDRFVMRLTDVRPGIHTGRVLEWVVMSSSVVTVPVCTMTRRSAVTAHSIAFDRNVVIGPDWDFWIQLAVHVEFGYLDALTCRYRIHTTNISRTTASEKRRKDGMYRRMKIMNSEWFSTMTLHTREIFFLDLLTRALSGDISMQQQILQSRPFNEISATRQSSLWRMVGIDALKGGGSAAQVRYFFEESLKLNPTDRKTRLLLTALKVGSTAALGLVRLWYFALDVLRRIARPRPSRTEHLQKLLGVK